ncbi:flagellar type III secretion system protein FliR [Dickeya sp. CFBP 2040]|uniref:Flagellar biosynthetic protein FliR n=1 Tax=Dickeya poaceiphila TaxID=568768 RepID=A0A5B8HK63_9GAMM|nr:MULTISPECIES: flagellar biosynthetic protein FliR [Dickeya]NKI74823.1 flagellar type III secretion system protein FliR [Dickeya sp. CFBP 2040]QDX29656.1 flagellar type III secretion system protein FliR [Dickeya poaceiphila]
MVTLNSIDMIGWFSQFFWPLVRILALISTAPIFSERAITRRVKIGLGILITIVITPGIPPTSIPIFSAAGIWMLFQQILIGVMLGFTMQLAFAAVRLAGEVIGLQMGLSFATFFDPSGGPNMPVIARFMNLLALLLFLTMNGHLWLISLLVDSFHTIPIGAEPVSSNMFVALAGAGGKIFSNGLMLAMPLITLLLAINMALGLLSRLAPQLTIFAIGFPITLFAGIITVGFLIFLISPYTEKLFGETYDLLADLLSRFLG